ncbi:MAG: uroporphyrinogen decarboxylase family protein [Phycisphaerae bacterium]
MNHRERFQATMHYQPLDRSPLYDFSFWDETLPEWHKQGLPSSVTRRNAQRYFGLDASLAGGDQNWEVGFPVNICPCFESVVIEDRGDHEIAQQGDGVRVLRKKYKGSIPQHVGHLLEDRASWEKHYKWRLDPQHSERWRDFDRRIAEWKAPRTKPLFVSAGSLFGHTRDAMGLENVALCVYDDPALFEEMVVTRTDCIVAVLERTLAAGVKFDGASMWEDMAYNAGPLLSPTHFERYLVPQYQRITSLLRRYGVDVIWVDCDGLIDSLIPLWLQAGVNCMFPIELGTWNADPVKLRAQYGKDLLMMGGLDKHILQRDPAAIEREIRRLAPLVESGGYIPMPDHRVPPDVPLKNYVFYCQKIREIWGRGVNLPPIGLTV